MTHKLQDLDVIFSHLKSRVTLGSLVSFDLWQTEGSQTQSLFPGEGMGPGDIVGLKLSTSPSRVAACAVASSIP